MRIFVVSPAHANLPDATIEISAIDRHHQAIICRGNVRDADITDELERALEGGPLDVFWWITHGDAEGFLLSDGRLSISGVRQYHRRAAVRLGLLNTCESESVARSVIVGGLADMICTVGQIGSKEAVRLGSLYAAELARTGDFYQAYEVVDPDDGTYKYIRAKATVAIAQPSPRRRIMPDEATELRQSIDQLRQSMNSSTVTMTELKGTMSMNNALTKQSMDALADQLTVFRAQVAARAPVWVAYLTVAFLAIIAAGMTAISLIWISQR